MQSFWCYIKREEPQKGGGQAACNIVNDIEKMDGKLKTEKCMVNDKDDACARVTRYLFLPNWKVGRYIAAPEDHQPPDYYVYGDDYWFFRYFKKKSDVDIIDIRSKGFLENFEKNKLRFYVIQALKAIPKLNKYDLIVSHGMQSGIVIAFWRRFFRTRSKHIVFDIGSFNSAAESGIALKLMQFASKSIDCIIYHTSSQKDYYEKFFPWIVEKSEFIKFGTDYDFFNREIHEQDCLYKTETADEYCICVGYSKRDWDTLVKAFQMADTGNLVLRLVGHVDEKYDGLANVEQIDFVSINELVSLIRNAKFSILPLKSYNYSYGQMTLMQQMALGKCVITSRVPSIIDYVEDGKTAILYEPENYEQLSGIIEKVNSDERLRQSIGERARNYIKNTNNEEVMAREIEIVTLKYLNHYK